MTIIEMLQALIGKGFTQALIATKVGATQPTISRILKGTPTNYELGKSIEALYNEVVAEKQKAS